MTVNPEKQWAKRERHLMNLLSHREKENKELREKLKAVEEQAEMYRRAWMNNSQVVARHETIYCPCPCHCD